VSDQSLDEMSQWVVQYAAQMTQRVKVEDALFKQLQSRLSNTEIVELTTAIAAYNMVARLLVALQITPEE
jgi:alkylhydroperoxidase family enzyme